MQQKTQGCWVIEETKNKKRKDKGKGMIYVSKQRGKKNEEYVRKQEV